MFRSKLLFLSAGIQRSGAAVSDGAAMMRQQTRHDTIVKTNPVAAAVASAVSAAIPKGSDPHRNNVISIFKTLANTNKTLGELHRARAYSRAIQLIGEHALANPGVPLTTAEQLKHIKGIGPKLYVRIDEIIKTGSLRELNNMFEDPNMNALMNISAVHGIGPKAALRFHKLHNITTIDELREKVDLGDIQLNAAQTIGLRYHEDFIKKIPFSECVDHKKFLQSEGKSALHKDIVVTICGSHRRALPYSGDIDILMSLPAEYADNSRTSAGPAGKASLKVPQDSHSYLQRFVQHLTNRQYILDTLGVGDTKFMGVCKLHGCDIARRIDIRWVSPESYPSALLYFTGSKVFNTRMREYALSKGYSLNEYGLYKLSDVSVTDSAASEKYRVPVSSEKDIFDILGFPFVLPEQRTA